MDADAVIRRARPDDVDALAALCIEHAAFEGVTLEHAPNPAALHAALFGDPAPLTCWVAEIGGAIAGYATATREFSTWEADYYLHMDCLYLRPGARGQALGKRLLGAVGLEAVQSCCGMQWQTPATNLGAAKFYRRNGARSKDKLRFYLSAAECRLLSAGV